MDAREQLRRYLEQRREMGESELVLDGMDVEEVMRIVGAPKGLAAPASRTMPGAQHATEAPEAGASARDAALESGPSDWREALKAAGAPANPAPAPIGGGRLGFTPPPETETRVTDSPPPAEGGIVVGSGERAPGEFAHLESLEAIAKVVSGCTRCPLYSTALNPVPGEGNPDADFMVVGEAPGASEDETGRPFVGAAGQLLTKILGAIKLEREDVFIANVLKHRPPGNRNPLPEEVAACSPYLLRQIELVRPKVILALGTFAAQTLLATKLPISKLRGQVHRYHGVPLIVTYHPAALLRNPSWKRPTWEDVQLARRVLDRAAGGA